MATKNTDSRKTVAAVCRQFRIPGELASVELITRGHINTTYKVTFENGGVFKSYVLQKINTYVFKNPVKIMKNIDLVSGHIRQKEVSNRVRLHYHHCENGNNYFPGNDGTFWRLLNFIDSAVFDLCEDERVLRGAGYAFGEFQSNLVDFDATQLYETIEDFHNTPKRLEKFFADVKADEYGRACEVAEEISYTEEMAPLAGKLVSMLEQGKLPVRVTHNDTKSNNILFDKNTFLPLTVIDLDTVMPGLVAYDFGDAIRTAANTATEDERELSRVSLDLRKFEWFADGFLRAAAKNLTENEINTLALGAFTLTFEQAVRFLDDYLTGDKYFRTEYEGHNLVRARCQYTLARDIASKLPEMQKIIQRLAYESRAVSENQ